MSGKSAVMKKRKKTTVSNQKASPQKGNPPEKQGRVTNGAKNKVPLVEAVRPSRQMLFLLCLALCISTIAVYSQLAGHDFVAFDDDQYVYENAHIKNGLTPSSIWWAFTTFYYANWHPLTWLSHMLDYQLFGLDAGGHHLINLLFHLLSAIVLFIAIARMTRKP